MPKLSYSRESTIERTARVIQLEGIFEVQPSPTSTVQWDIDIPIETFDWNIGVIVGPSGSGKSTLASELFPDSLMPNWEWHPTRSIVDSFPKSLGIKEITTLLSQVGFSSPPSWLRPYNVLSNGEQFRVSIARGLAEQQNLLAVDEFTSVVDRTVAQIGSAAVAKAVRRRNQKFVAISCHYDILDWIQPDWVYDIATHKFARDCLQRPQINLEIHPVPQTYWKYFRKYHYLSHSCNRMAHCYSAFYNGRPIAFTAVLHFPHPTGTRWKEHRTVCHPDFQGVEIGNALSNYIASAYSGFKGRKYTSVTGNPAMIHYRAKSPLWKLMRPPSVGKASRDAKKFNPIRTSHATNRLTASFEYVGPKNPQARKLIGIL